MKKIFLLLVLILIAFSSFTTNESSLVFEVKTEVAQASIVKMYVQDNYFFMEYDGELLQSHKSKVTIIKHNISATAYAVFFENTLQNPKNIEFANIRDANDLAFTDQATFEEWIYRNTGFNTASGGSGAVTPEHVFNGVDRAAAETARDVFFAANPTELITGVRLVLIFNNTGIEQVYDGTNFIDLSTVFSAEDIKNLYESNPDTNAFEDLDESKLDAVKLYPSLTEETAEIVSLKSIRVPTGSIDLDDSGVLSSNSRTIEFMDMSRNRRSTLISSKYTDAGSETPKYYNYTGLMAFMVQPNIGEVSGSFSFTAPVIDEPDREGIKFSKIVIQANESGIGRFSFKYENDAGTTIQSFTDFTVDPGEVGNDKTIILENSIDLFDGENVYVTYVGIDLRGALVEGNFIPKVQTMSHEFTIEEFAMSGDVTSLPASAITVDDTDLNALLTGSGDVQTALNRIDATGIGASVTPFTGSFIASAANIGQWYGNRQSVTMEGVRGQTNANRTFTLPRIDELNTVFDDLESKGIGQIFTITIGYLGGSSTFISRNSLRIQAPSISALFNINEIPTTLASGSSATFRIDRVNGSIGTWARISSQETPSSVDAFGDLEFQNQGWNNGDGTLLPSQVQKGYAYKVFNSDPNDGTLRAGLVSLGITDKVIYNDDWVVWTADSFTNWGNNKDDWFVLSADDVRRISLPASNFLTNVEETDTKIDVGLVQDNGAVNGLIWLSPEIMIAPPFLDPNSDSNNPRSNADGVRYVGGNLNVDSEGFFDYGANFFNSQLYLGITPSFVAAHTAERIDITVSLDNQIIQRFNLENDFTQLTTNGFSNATVNHYIHSSSFNYPSNAKIGIVLTEIKSTFGLSQAVNVTPNVSDIQENQLASDIQILLNRVKDIPTSSGTDFSSILDRISPYEQLQINEVDHQVYFDSSNPSQNFPTSLSGLTQVDSENPTFAPDTDQMFLFVQGGPMYILRDLDSGGITILDNSDPNVDLGISITVSGVSYFGYRVTGLTPDNNLEVERVTFTQVVEWQNDIDELKSEVQSINDKLKHAVLDLPDAVVNILKNNITVTEESVPNILATDLNTSFTGSQAFEYEASPNAPNAGELNSVDFKDLSGSFVNKKMIYLRNDASNYTGFAVKSSTNINLIEKQGNQFYARQFVAATPSGTQTVTVAPLPSNQVEHDWFTVAALTFQNGIPVPEADELFFTRQLPSSDATLNIAYRGHSNGNIFGTGSTTLANVGGAAETATTFVLDDGGETATVEVRYYPNFQGSGKSIRVSVTERVNNGLPTINDVEVKLTYEEVRVVPGSPETTRAVLLSNEVSDNDYNVFSLKKSSNNTAVIVGPDLEVDTKYLFTDLFASDNSGSLVINSETGAYLNYNFDIHHSAIQTLQNSSTLQQFGLFTTEYTHLTVVHLGTQLTILKSDGSTLNLSN